MYPASEILKHAALRSNSGPLDPLHVAKEIGVSATDALDWRVVARMNVPPVMSEDGRIVTKPAGTLSILMVGNPCRGLLFCFDRGEARECVRLYPDGVRFAIIEGVRRDELLEHQVTPHLLGKHIAELGELTAEDRRRNEELDNGYRGTAPRGIPEQMLELVDDVSKREQVEKTYEQGFPVRREALAFDEALEAGPAEKPLDDSEVL